MVCAADVELVLVKDVTGPWHNRAVRVIVAKNTCMHSGGLILEEI